jgi:hypothetical protein
MYFGDTNHRRENPCPHLAVFTCLRVYCSPPVGVLQPEVQVLFPPSALSLPKCSSRRTLYSSNRALFPGGRRPEVQVFFLHSSLYIPKCSLRSTLYSTRSALFLIVFLESKVVKSVIHTPIYSRPTRASRPNAHIWPRLILKKASKSAFFNGEVVAQDGVMPSLRTSAIRIADVAPSATPCQAAAPHSGSKGNRSPQARAMSRKAASRRYHPRFWGHRPRF